MQTYFEGDQISLFDQDTSAGKTSWAYSAQARRTGRISGLSWSQLLDYIAPPYQFLDLTLGAGNLLGQFEWEMRSALHGGAFLRNTGPSPRDATESCLSQILEDHPPKKYYLTTAACLGILRRAKERGKPLPKALDTALRIQAGLIGLPESSGKTVPFDDSAAFAQPGMRQQTFAASFFCWRQRDGWNHRLRGRSSPNAQGQSQRQLHAVRFVRKRSRRAAHRSE